MAADEYRDLTEKRYLLETQYDTYSNRIGFIPKFLESKASQSVAVQMNMVQDLERDSIAILDNDQQGNVEKMAQDLDTVHIRLVEKRQMNDKKSKQMQEYFINEELKEEEQALSLILACVDSWTRKTNSLRVELSKKKEEEATSSVKNDQRRTVLNSQKNDDNRANDVRWCHKGILLITCYSSLVIVIDIHTPQRLS
jgi:hypothetical protein